MSINATTNPAEWNAGEAILWRAVDAAQDYYLTAKQARLKTLNEAIAIINDILCIETETEESPRLSFNAQIVLSRLQGEKICMDTDRHIEGITELAKKGVIAYNKKSKKWRVSK